MLRQIGLRLIGLGQRLVAGPIGGGAPANAIRNDQGGYVRNASGGYVLAE